MSLVPCVRQSSVAAAIPPRLVATKIPESAVHLVIVDPSPPEAERWSPDAREVHRLARYDPDLLLRCAALPAELQRVERTRRRRHGQAPTPDRARLRRRQDRGPLHAELVVEVTALEADPRSREARYPIRPGLQAGEEEGTPGRAVPVLAALEQRSSAIRAPEIGTIVRAAGV